MPTGPDRPDPTAAARRDRRLDEVFGDVLPDTTADERDPAGGDRSPGTDDWYLENRPPHHDRD